MMLLDDKNFVSPGVALSCSIIPVPPIVSDPAVFCTSRVTPGPAAEVCNVPLFVKVAELSVIVIVLLDLSVVLAEIVKF